MRIILLISIFIVFLQNNHYSLASLQETPQAELGDPCQFVTKGSAFATFITENLHNLPISYGHNRLPIEFYIDDNIPQYLIGPIHEASSEWNTEAGFEIVTIKGIHDNVNMNILTDHRNIIYWGDEYMFNSRSSLAVISVPFHSPIIDILTLIYNSIK